MVASDLLECNEYCQPIGYGDYLQHYLYGDREQCGLYSYGFNGYFSRCSSYGGIFPIQSDHLFWLEPNIDRYPNGWRWPIHLRLVNGCYDCIDNRISFQHDGLYGYDYGQLRSYGGVLCHGDGECYAYGDGFS